MEKGLNQWIQDWYEKQEQKVMELMRAIWEHPELSLKEYFAAQAAADFARKEGFTRVELHAAEDFLNEEAKPNTVIAVWGSGKPVIGIVGELDALPDLGQECVPYHKAVPGPGHGCGHNTMAGCAAAAASALKYAMEKEGLKGTVKLVQAPAEEIGVGKAYLAKAGVFSDMDMALMWHPFYGPLDFSPFHEQIAFSVNFEFHGKAAHAAALAHEGRSALDAVQLMNMGCEFMREHVKKDTWMHYIITNGGSAPNTVPDYASSRYMFRALDDYDTAEHMFRRAVEIAKGAAMMTETRMEYQVTSVMPQFYFNRPLYTLMHDTALEIEPLTYTEEEYELAKELYRNVNPDKEMPEDREELLPTGVAPLSEMTGLSCTDAADMSYFCPTVHFQGLARIRDCQGHSWNVTYLSGCPLGMKPAVYASKIIAQSAYKAVRDPKIVEACWEAYREQKIPPYKAWV